LSAQQRQFRPLSQSHRDAMDRRFLATALSELRTVRLRMFALILSSGPLFTSVTLSIDSRLPSIPPHCFCCTDMLGKHIEMLWKGGTHRREPNGTTRALVHCSLLAHGCGDDLNCGPVPAIHFWYIATGGCVDQGIPAIGSPILPCRSRFRCLHSVGHLGLVFGR
jgi:hypothetical protein